MRHGPIVALSRSAGPVVISRRRAFAAGATILATIYLCLALPPAARAEDIAFPDSPAGKAFATWLNVVREGDDEGIKRHFEKAFTEAYQTEIRFGTYEVIMTNVHKAVITAEFKHVEGGDDFDIVAYALMKNKVWMKVTMTVEQAPPHLITGLLIQPGDPPVNDADAFKSAEDLKDLLPRLCKIHGIPAIAAAYIKADKVVDHAAAGVRALGSDEKVAPDDLFHLGSLTKSITATLVGRLIEEGKLDWDTTLAKVLPDIQMRDAYRSVTVEQLLRHRGGIQPMLTFDGDQLDRLVALPGSPTEQRREFVEDVLMMEPVHTPGLVSEYSNAGYALVGYLAERATGKSWSDLVTEHVFKPFGLKTAGFGWPATHARPHQPHGHMYSGSLLQVQDLGEYDLGHFMAPAGDISMSIDDLARFAAYHLAGLRGQDGPLKAATIQRLHTPASGDNYAGGWVIATAGGDLMHWHNGSAGTFFALMCVFPESNEAIVVTMNQADEVENLARRIAEAVRKK